jgi:tRNA nucleotidyltransferase (CCA-adding enzyme)
VEIEVFNVLKEVVQVNNTGSTLRVAGGWVRDRLLGKESHDIDIAIDNLMGEAFGKLVYAHTNSTKTIGTIKANPDASKHLETACIKLCGFEIDLVNLRTESYTQDSRIPQISIGTP